MLRLDAWWMLLCVHADSQLELWHSNPASLRTLLLGLNSLRNLPSLWHGDGMMWCTDAKHEECIWWKSLLLVSWELQQLLVHRVWHRRTRPRCWKLWCRYHWQEYRMTLFKVFTVFVLPIRWLLLWLCKLTHWTGYAFLPFLFWSNTVVFWLVHFSIFTISSNLFVMINCILVGLLVSQINQTLRVLFLGWLSSLAFYLLNCFNSLTRSGSVFRQCFCHACSIVVLSAFQNELKISECLSQHSSAFYLVGSSENSPNLNYWNVGELKERKKKSLKGGWWAEYRASCAVFSTCS